MFANTSNLKQVTTEYQMYTHKCIDYKCIRTKWGKVKIEQKTNKKTKWYTWMFNHKP